MVGVSTIFSRVLHAVHRARLAVFLMSCAYAIGLIVGLVAVHTGHQWTLTVRDRIVSKAQASSPILRHYKEGQRMAAGALDCADNLIGATATAAAGWWAPAPFPIAIYRGWVGGIVSVDNKHRSRFRSRQSGLYYVLVLTLQLVAYTLAGGAGVNLGLARTSPRPEYQGARLLGVPHEALRDAAYIYGLVIPIFAFASALEFLW
jgi:hypothetical protein